MLTKNIGMTLARYYAEVYEPLKLRSRTEKSKLLYRITLRHFDEFLKRPARMTDLNDDAVTAYLAWFRSLPRSPATVNKERANLLAMWRFANRRNLVASWPNVDREPEPHREPQAWLEPEMRKLFEACQRQPGTIGKLPAAAFWSALVLTLWDSGERISAILGLTWDNVDLRGGWLRCPAEIRKGGHADRVYRITAETVEALRKLRKSPGFVFPWPYHAKYLWRRFGAILDGAGLPSDSKSKFHRIRRTVASYYEAAGGDATQLLGHSGRRVTLAYLDARISHAPQACDKLWKLTARPVKARSI